MMLTLCVGTGIGIGILTGASSSTASAALGGILALYGLVSLLVRRFSVPAKAELWLSPLVGLLTGVITGATGVFVIPAVPYLGSLDLSKDELIQALGLSFTVSTIALAAALAWTGHYKLTEAATAYSPFFPRLPVCSRTAPRDKLHPEAFRRWFLVGLAVLGLYMLLRALLPA